jgi:nucleoid DNA-binding protein
LAAPVALFYVKPFGGPMASSARTTDIAEHVAKKTGLSNKQAKQAVTATFEGVAMLLKKNERVTVTGIGAFSKKVKPATKGGKKAINPFTKEPYTTKSKPASTKVRFRAGKGFTQHLGK